VEVCLWRISLVLVGARYDLRLSSAMMVAALVHRLFGVRLSNTTNSTTVNFVEIQ
jgi:hypothetical protein